MSDNRKEQSKRFTLKGWRFILVALMVVAGLLALYIMITRGRLNRRLEALRAAGYPTNFAELAEYNKLPEGVPNAAGLYTEAFAAFSEGPSALADRLASNGQCLALLHQAAGIPDCDYDWDWREYTTGMSPLTDVRHCIQLLGSAATHYASAGDPNGAMTCIKDGLRLADSLRREPTLIAYLVRTACIGAMVASLQEGLGATAFTNAQLVELDEAMVASAGTLDFTQALITERCFMIETCGNPMLVGTPGKGIRSQVFRSVTRGEIDDILDYMHDCIEASRLPLTERLTGFGNATKKLENLPVFHFMMKLLAPPINRAAEIDLRARAGIDLARTALAIERYRLATGKVPESLEELVPQYLREVPIDPFDGKPIRYIRAERGYRLYSTLEDGQDNAGKDKNEVNRGEPYDRPFTVTR
jgi:hypothetical protein